MIVTDEEARTKMCPQDMAAGNLSGMCIGSKCMAWRWEPLKADADFMAAVKKVAEETGDKSNGFHVSAKAVMADRAKYGLPTKPFEGYCGLAGKP